ncbi:MAG TPA: hypothetical protein DIW77_16665 [Chromatiaceae bacterium]|nr:hypothetical protein [Chromatiaceae bacterium]
MGLAITLVASVVGLAIGLARSEPLLWTLLGLLLGRVLLLERSLHQLRQTLDALRSAQPRDAPLPQAPQRSPPAAAEPIPKPAARSGSSIPPALPSAAALSASPSLPPPATRQQSARAPASTVPPQPAAGSTVVDTIIDWLQSGNLFLRIGILVLFFAVAFLIKYAVERELIVFTPQLRLLSIGAGGTLLLALGWYLRAKRRDYGLLLQGAGIGILYLDVYGAFQLYHLLPDWLAFLALLLIGLLAAALAILQDAPALAWFGFAGGFLAPLATAGDSGRHTVLFGFYAMLDGAILAVAWFKRWRALNLLGFGFTFAVVGAWVILRYTPALLPSTEPFLILFFLFFVAITILYSLHQPPRLKGWIDATLLFATPALSFSCQVALVRHIEYAIAVSAALLGLFYLLLAWLIGSRSEALALLARAFNVLGLIFLSLAVPYALSETQTAAVWALQGAGMVWIGSLQQRPGVRALGVLLQIGAAMALLFGALQSGSVSIGTTAFLNPFYTAAAMLGIAGGISSYWLDRPGFTRQAWQQNASIWLLLWGLGWWFGAGLLQLWQFYPDTAFPAGLLLYGVFSGLLLEACVTLRPWTRLRRVQTALPALGLLALLLSFDILAHPAQAAGVFAWPLMLSICWLLLYRIEVQAPAPSLLWGHLLTGLLLILVLQWQLLWLVIDYWQLQQGWRVAGVVLAPLALLQLAMHGRGWPLAGWRFAYALLLGAVLAAFILAWSLWSASSPGGMQPFRWLPLLNPSDLMLALAVLTLYQWSRILYGQQRIGRLPETIPPDDLAGGHPHQSDGMSVRGNRPGSRLHEQPLFWIMLGGLAFLWLNLVLLRTMHHWWGVVYSPEALLASVPTQMAVSVLWGLTGVALLLLARRTGSRPFWFSGATILAAVVAKLFLVDLAASGTLERIISFFAVGLLLMGVGWFAQLPARQQADETLHSG